MIRIDKAGITFNGGAENIERWGDYMRSIAENKYLNNLSASIDVLQTLFWEVSPFISLNISYNTFTNLNTFEKFGELYKQLLEAMKEAEIYHYVRQKDNLPSVMKR